MTNSDVCSKSFHTLKCFGTQRANNLSILIDLGMFFIGVYDCFPFSKCCVLANLTCSTMGNSSMSPLNEPKI